MKLKKLSKLVVVSGLVVAFGAGSIFADGEVGGTKDSNVGVTFEQSDAPTAPVDPEDPDNTIDLPGGGGGTPGPLSIDFVSDLDFGIKQISSQNETYYALPQKTWAPGQDKGEESPNGPTKPNFVQVTDNRGSETGWYLTVQQNGQLETADNKVLTGAELKFKNARIVTTSNSGLPTGSSVFTLNPNGDKEPVMTAADGQGAGTYLTVFGNDETKASSIELSVPKNTTKYADKKYSTTLTWTLTDAPQI